MQFTKEQLQGFKDLRKKHFDEEITDQVALEQATKLVNLVKLVYKPLPKDK